MACAIMVHSIPEYNFNFFIHASKTTRPQRSADAVPVTAAAAGELHTVGSDPHLDPSPVLCFRPRVATSVSNRVALAVRSRPGPLEVGPRRPSTLGARRPGGSIGLPELPAHLVGSGRIVASEIEAPNMLAILV